MLRVTAFYFHLDWQIVFITVAKQLKVTEQHMIRQYIHADMEYGSCTSINEYAAHFISGWIRLHCFNFIKGPPALYYLFSVVSVYGTETLCDGIGASREGVEGGAGEGSVGEGAGGLIPGSPHPNECIIRLWFAALHQTAGNNLLPRCLFPKCLLPKPDPATLSVAFYLQSACCPYVTLIVAIILVQQGLCFISPE